jgi:hypothetical protein
MVSRWGVIDVPREFSYPRVVALDRGSHPPRAAPATVVAEPSERESPPGEAGPEPDPQAAPPAEQRGAGSA